ATELIDASERALSDWRSQPDSADFRLGLKRPLHTLKGGARVAGITPMGDLSHELETLVMAVDNGTVAADVAVFDVIQASLDELARMREQVVNGRPVAAARAIITRLQSLSGSAAATAARPRARGGGRAPGDGARGRGSARPDAEHLGRGEHCARAPRAAARLVRFQPRGAVAYGDAPEGAAAQSRDRDRGADPAQARGRRRAPQRVRSARARPLFLHPAVLAGAGRDGQRRGEHPAAAREPRQGHADGAAAAG